MPGHLVRKAHFEGAFFACDVRIKLVCFFVELARCTAIAKTPAEIWFGREKFEEVETVVSVFMLGTMLVDSRLDVKFLLVESFCCGM